MMKLDDQTMSCPLNVEDKVGHQREPEVWESLSSIEQNLSV